MSQRFYSNGKLMLTGEYLVLDGAMALALPTKSGQDLVVESGSGKQIFWKSHDHDGAIWFGDVISFSDISGKCIPGNNPVRDTLIEILHEAWKIDPSFLAAEGYSVTTNLTFPRSWGFGTSSTLINNIAQWLNIDAFVLLKNSFGGSGYDIACAQHNQPVLYQLQNRKPKIRTVDFNPEFSAQLYFVYLNKKQSSKSAISSYYKQHKETDTIVPAIDAVTEQLLQAADLEEFSALLEKHESILSGILHSAPVKELLFPDFEGTVKSLGAWGGDFVLAVSSHDPTAYFMDKGYTTIIPYAEMIL